MQQIKSGYYWIRVTIVGEDDKWMIGSWNGRQFLTIRPYYDIVEVGEKIPDQQLLKAASEQRKEIIGYCSQIFDKLGGDTFHQERHLLRLIILQLNY